MTKTITLIEEWRTLHPNDSKSIRSKYLTTFNDLTISDLILSENELPRRSFVYSLKCCWRPKSYISGGTVSISAINKYRIPSPIPFLLNLFGRRRTLGTSPKMLQSLVKLLSFGGSMREPFFDCQIQIISKQLLPSLSKGYQIWQEFWVYIIRFYAGWYVSLKICWLNDAPQSRTVQSL